MRVITRAYFTSVFVQPIVFLLSLVINMIPGLVRGLTISVNDFYGLGFLFMSVLVVAAIYTLVIGVPIFFLLKYYDRLSWTSVTLAGIVAAAVPDALFSWPLWTDYSGYTSGGNWYGHYVEFIKDGVFTVYGWIRYVEEVFWFGIHGLVGAAVFYYVWLRHTPNKSFQ